MKTFVELIRDRGKGKHYRSCAIRAVKGATGRRRASTIAILKPVNRCLFITAGRMGRR